MRRDIGKETSETLKWASMCSLLNLEDEYTQLVWIGVGAILFFDFPRGQETIV